MKEEVAQYLNMLEVEGMRKNTVEAYGRDVKQMTEWLRSQGCINSSHVTQEAIELYTNHLEATHKTSATFARKVASTRRFVKYLKESGHEIDTSCLNKTTTPSRKPFLVLTKNEVQSLLKAPDVKSLLGLRDYIMLKMLYETGIKVTEIIELTVKDIDFKRKRIVCNTPYEQRTVLITPELVKHFKKYLAMRSLDLNQIEEPLFVNCYGQRISRQGLWKIVKQYAQIMELDKSTTPHTLRHSFAVHLLQDGGTTKHLQMIMGHQDLTSTQVYETYLECD